ncbi:MAG: hypothetical protein JO217_01805 [Acidobacteriaceae bacterium]|nr:hypothetical protein [Acidobacteriaceae bacterium]
MAFRENTPPIGIRWTVGDVSEAGFETLRLSLWSAWNLFGNRARYLVCVNTVPVRTAGAKTGEVPAAVRWLATDHLVPSWLRQHSGPEMAEGVAWKLAPVRVFPDRYELSLDNDVVLWSIPPEMHLWLNSPAQDACLFAADVLPALGQFAGVCGHRPLNSGIRGLPPHFDLERRLKDKLSQSGVRLQSELDEQGLQAAVFLDSTLFVLSTADVSVCSPFPNHQRRLGRCGVHFVGLNPKRLPWILDGRGAHEVIREHWDLYVPEVSRLAGDPLLNVLADRDLKNLSCSATPS